MTHGAATAGREGSVPGPHIDLSVYASEAELLDGLRAGEPDACTCLVKRFAPLVYAKALRMLADPDEAEGVLQLTFIKACEKIGYVRGAQRPGHLALPDRDERGADAAAARPCRKDPQSTRSTKIQLLADLPQNLQRLADRPGAHDAERRAARPAGARARGLPASLRVVFVLREIEGLSTDETAAALELGESAVKVRLHRARLRLRELLAGYLATEGDGS